MVLTDLDFAVVEAGEELLQGAEAALEPGVAVAQGVRLAEDPAEDVAGAAGEVGELHQQRHQRVRADLLQSPEERHRAAAAPAAPLRRPGVVPGSRAAPLRAIPAGLFQPAQLQRLQGPQGERHRGRGRGAARGTAAAGVAGRARRPRREKSSSAQRPR